MADHALLRRRTAVGTKEFPFLLVLCASDLNRRPWYNYMMCIIVSLLTRLLLFPYTSSADDSVMILFLWFPYTSSADDSVTTRFLHIFRWRLCHDSFSLFSLHIFRWRLCVMPLFLLFPTYLPLTTLSWLFLLFPYISSADDSCHDSFSLVSLHIFCWRLFFFWFPTYLPLKTPSARALSLCPHSVKRSSTLSQRNPNPRLNSATHQSVTFTTLAKKCPEDDSIGDQRQQP